MAGGLSDRRGFSNRWLVGQAWVQQVVVKQIGSTDVKINRFTILIC